MTLLVSTLLAFALVSPHAPEIVIIPTYTVNSSADVVDANPGDFKCETAANNGVCTLRAAVMEANTHASATIILPAGTYLLTIPNAGALDPSTGDLDILSDVTIEGAGPASTIIDAGVMQDSVFYVGLASTLTMSGVALRKGVAQNGGGVNVAGTLHLTDSVITICSVSGGTGGAIYGKDASIVLERCQINHCGGRALFFRGATSGSVKITDCTITANPEGGIDILDAPVTISSSTISGNTSQTGGGISYAVSSPPLTLVNTTVSDNSARDDGGGIYALGPVALYSCTIAHNAADSDHNGGGGRGGGIFNASATSVVTLRDTIVADNVGTVFFNGFYFTVDSDCHGSVTSNGYSLLGTTAGCTLGGPYSVGDPLLGPLQDNGGRTATRALLAGSPAIDAGNPSGCDDALGAILTGDQRGVHRALGVHCDIGAYESGSPKGDVNGDGVVDVADVFYLVNTLFAGGPFPPGIANVNGDGSVTVADVFYLINYLFAGGPAPV